MGGRAHRGLPIETATDVSVYTRVGVERIQRFAFELARKRPRKRLTLGHQVQCAAPRHGDVGRGFLRGGEGYPDVKQDRELVDAMTTRMVLKPATIDVMVCSNLHADILSDLAAALSGSLGIAPTRTSTRARVPVDVRADPRLGLRHHRQGHRQSDRHLLDRGDDARASRARPGGGRLMKAIEKVTASGMHTPDLGGKATTADRHREVKANLVREMASGPETTPISVAHLELAGPHQALHRRASVDAIDLAVEPGEFICLLGPLGLRQDHDAAHDRGLHRARRGPHPVDGKVVSGRARWCRPSAATWA
jgi:tartrate dehydrogenase/decarboxylase/D-malate dehydrogenase